MKIGRGILCAAVAALFCGVAPAVRADAPITHMAEMVPAKVTVKITIHKFSRKEAAKRKWHRNRIERARKSARAKATAPDRKIAILRKNANQSFCASDPLRITALTRVAGWSIDALVKPFIRPFKATEPLEPWQYGLIDEREDTIQYLVRTATPGGTMTRQGVRVSVERLNPEFAMRLANAIREARANGLPNAGVFSAYRPPAFGVGGFGDKNRSLHSYGLAVDMAGIGGPGSRNAIRWHQIAGRYKIVGPYGAFNRAEWNHMQGTNLVAVAVGNVLRSTITAAGPRILSKMWEVSAVFLNERIIVKAVADKPRFTRYAHRNNRVRYARHFRHHRIKYANSQDSRIRKAVPRNDQFATAIY